MERMTKGEGMTPEEYIAMVEEENKKLEEKLGEKIDTIQVLIREKYEEKGEKLELFKENKKLKKKIELLDNENMCLNAEIKDREEENKKLKSDLEEIKNTLEHRDSVLSIMYDLLRSDLGDYEQLCMIDVVIDVEVGNEPQNKLREELLDRFWKRDF